jgi:hypothetical protein
VQLGSHIDGRVLTRDKQSGQFAIDGVPVTREQVLQHDASGQIQWLNKKARAQALSPARRDRSEPSAGSNDWSWELLGFRSKRLWKMTIASTYYVAWLGAVASVGKPRVHAGDAGDRMIEIASTAVLALLLISPALLLSEFQYRDRLPLFKHRKVAWSAAGLALVLALCSLAIGAIDSLHSPAYKAAAALLDRR